MIVTFITHQQIRLLTMNIPELGRYFHNTLYLSLTMQVALIRATRVTQGTQESTFCRCTILGKEATKLFLLVRLVSMIVCVGSLIYNAMD